MALNSTTTETTTTTTVAPLSTLSDNINNTSISSDKPTIANDRLDISETNDPNYIKLNSDTESISIVPIGPQHEIVPLSAQNSYANCANHSRLPDQPVTSECAKISKCCPKGQNYRTVNDTKHECNTENVYFNVEVIVAEFFDRCIEDMEEYLELDYAYGYPCAAGSQAFVYSMEYGDSLYVIQNGSLLRIDENFESFDVFDDYCLDMDRESKMITAYVCNQTFGSMVHVSKAQSYVYAICRSLCLSDIVMRCYMAYVEFINFRVARRYANIRSVSHCDNVFLFGDTATE